jgi:hypothetical protein
MNSTAEPTQAPAPLRGQYSADVRGGWLSILTPATRGQGPRRSRKGSPVIPVSTAR